jgi:hypothetical protein
LNTRENVISVLASGRFMGMSIRLSDALKAIENAHIYIMTNGKKG